MRWGYKRVITWVVGGILLASVGAGIWFLQSPYYTLWKVRRAIIHHDFETFKQYVEVDTLSRYLLNDLIEFAMASEDSVWIAAGDLLGTGIFEFTPSWISLLIKALEVVEHVPDEEWVGIRERASGVKEKIRKTLTGGFLKILRPQLEEILKEQLQLLVEGKAKPESLFMESRVFPTGMALLNFRGVKFVQVRGQKSIVGLAFGFSEDWIGKSVRENILKLELKKSGWRWMIMKIENTCEFLQNIVYVFDVLLEERNAPILQEMNTLLTLERFWKDTSSEWMGLSRKIHLYLTFHNRSQDTIDVYQAKVIVEDLRGRVLKTLILRDTADVPPSSFSEKVWTFRVGILKDEDVELYSLLSHQINVRAEVNYLRFKDGKELYLYGPYELMQELGGLKNARKRFAENL